jgi:hypothetical protein
VFEAGGADEVTWSATDATSGLRVIRVRLDSVIIDRDLPLGGPFLPGSVEPGEHELFVRAHDNAGNYVTYRFDFTVDEVLQAWHRRTIYRAGDRVTYAGKVWEAAWWTRGDRPGSPRSAWQEIAPPDANGIAPWTRTRIYKEGDQVNYKGKVWEARWWNRNQRPADKRHGPWALVG